MHRIQELIGISAELQQCLSELDRNDAADACVIADLHLLIWAVGMLESFKFPVLREYANIIEQESEF